MSDETPTGAELLLKKTSLRNYVTVLDLGRGVLVKTNSKQFTLEYGTESKQYYSSLDGVLAHLWKLSLQKKMEQRATDVKGLLDAVKEATAEIQELCKRNGWT